MYQLPVHLKYESHTQCEHAQVGIDGGVGMSEATIVSITIISDCNSPELIDLDKDQGHYEIHHGRIKL